MSKLYKDESPIVGVGLYTPTAYKKNETIAYIHGPTHVFRNLTPTISKKTLNWIGAGRYTWINTDSSEFRFINHSCDPNTAIVTKRKVIAIKNIKANEELTMDYSLTEAEPGWKIENCHCGATQCRGTIGPIMDLPKRNYQKYKSVIPKNFQRIYEQGN